MKSLAYPAVNLKPKTACTKSIKSKSRVALKRKLAGTKFLDRHEMKKSARILLTQSESVGVVICTVLRIQ